MHLKQLRPAPFQAIPKIQIPPITIKGEEKIVWTVGENWFLQLKEKLEKYRALPRSKSKAHRNFADNLQTLIQNYATILNKPNPNADPAITQAISAAANPILGEILKLLSSKTGLSEKGFDRQPSWLYAFCKVAMEQYSYSKFHEAFKQEINRTNKHVITELSGLVEKLKSELAQMQTQNTIIQQSINDINIARVKEAEQASTARQRLTKELDQTKGDLEETKKESDVEKEKLKTLEALRKDQQKESNAAIALKQQELLRLEQSLESIKQNYTGASTEAAALRRQNEQLVTITRDHGVAMEKLAVATTANRGLIAENEALKKELENTRKELSTLQKCYDGLKGWVDNLFGNSLGQLISSFFEKESSPPKLTDDHEKYIRRIASTQAAEITPDFKEGMDNVAKSFEEDKTIHGKANVLASSIINALSDPAAIKRNAQALAESTSDKVKAFLPTSFPGSGSK
jgi:myosin heavy subunit